MLALAARYGPQTLILGLAAGFALPDLAADLRPYLPHMVAALLFMAALQIAPRDILGSLKEAPATASQIAIQQIALPLIVVIVGLLLDLTSEPAFLALFIVSAAPSISGSPNMMIMLGRHPAPALRLLILGTAVTPLTVLLLFPLVPAFGTPVDVGLSALRLAAIILVATITASFLRRRFLSNPSDVVRHRLRGASNILLAVFVVGLMEAMQALVFTQPLIALGWLAFAFAVNFGYQLIGWAIAKRVHANPRVAFALINGNRNFALFFIALDPEITTPLLNFMACYQIPMYLTPILLGRLYRQP